MGCACCKSRVDPPPLQKPGTTALPPTQMGTLSPTDQTLPALQEACQQLSLSLQSLESETDSFDRRARDHSISAAGLSGELAVSRKILDSIKSELAQCRKQLSAAEDLRAPGVTVEEVRERFAADHNDEFVADLQTIDSVEKYRSQFAAKVAGPKEEEEKLQVEGKLLCEKWEKVIPKVEELIDKAQHLRTDIDTDSARASRSSTTVGGGGNRLAESKSKDESALLEASVVMLSQNCSQHLLMLQGILSKLHFAPEMEALMGEMQSDCETAKKEIEDFLLALPFTLQSEEQVFTNDAGAPVTESENKEVVEEVFEESAAVFEEQEMMVAAEPEEAMVAAEPEETIVPGEPFRSSLDHNMSWMSSDVTMRDSFLPSSMSVYEVLDLFENAIAQAPPRLLPADCVKHYISSQHWEHSLYDSWLEALRAYSGEFQYARTVLALLQQTAPGLSRDAAAVFPAVICACNQFVHSVDLDNAADAFTELVDEDSQVVHTGGLMYWVDCISMIYEQLTKTVGMMVLKSLRPESVNVQEYVTFQICHKMHSQQTDGIRIFQLLDINKNGKLDAGEFSQGLSQLLSLWIDPDDLSFTFKSLYNRWSGLVSKAQFSKQVNFSEYIHKTKSEMAFISKYQVVTAVLAACQSVIEDSVAVLKCDFAESELREVGIEEVRRCAQVAANVSAGADAERVVKEWEKTVREKYGEDQPKLTFEEAKKLYIDVLCR